ncbi:hypothetical protein FH972_023533 [Carpinus fangiana]|uniref:UBC core domain-containing protein n=1 Tax=Carpinus fangiana TaxID=176857 RepID=A0A5N6KVQ0_9ROSI|nr:hypothetical protein FH972_023533 [Carpinus fangiana]
MGRKDFLADLAIAKATPFPNLSAVQSGSDSSEILAQYQAPDNGPSGSIILLILESSQYPKSHQWSIFAGDDTHSSVLHAISTASTLPELASHTAVSSILHTLSVHITQSLTARAQGMIVNDEAQTLVSPPSSDYESDDYDLDDEPVGLVGGNYNMSSNIPKIRLIDDMRAAKSAGFRVAHLGSLQESGLARVVSISCRISKLALSEEAMQAWAIAPTQYLILLLHFPFGYESFNSALDLDQSAASQRIQMCVCMSTEYRPASLDEALGAFKSFGSTGKNGATSNPVRLQESFLSRPLYELLNGRFLPILKYRIRFLLDWDQAEQCFIDLQNQSTSHVSIEHENFVDHVKSSATSGSRAYDLSSLVAGDQLRDAGNDWSLPLIAMQFTLRHFVRCTDFCLVCFRPMEEQFTAIKPYVCDRPLCLYQYMSLGFGPNIEHEVINFPYVVDTLVSFCHSGATGGALRDYPQGINLQVPDPKVCFKSLRRASALFETSEDFTPSAPTMDDDAQPSFFQAIFDPNLRQLTFTASSFSIEYSKACSLRQSDWLFIEGFVSTTSEDESERVGFHCRVHDKLSFPDVIVSIPLHGISKTTENVHACVLVGNPQAVQVHPWQTKFDDIENLSEKGLIIQFLIDLLPSVHDMRKYILGGAGRTLATWTDQISGASLGLLRWIIASNRSCIIPVDHLESRGDEILTFKLSKGEHRVQGMEGWMQFRIAMGSPDKERKFIKSIREVSAHKPFPTLFAWHGSSTANWHSIIRNGLDFSKTAHGRAYGHGCYHAKDLQTSMTYSARSINIGWSNSELKMSSAIALSEIVNSPSDFVSSSPFYVIAQTEWIQTRYLFIRPAVPTKFDEISQPDGLLAQDPMATAKGLISPVKLPSSAISYARNVSIGKLQTAEPAKKKRKLDFGPHFDVLDAGLEGDVDDTASMTTVDEDREFLLEVDGGPMTPVPNTHVLENVSPFELLPLRHVPVMPLPSYATSTASKWLQREYMALLNTQAEHLRNGTIQEAGWYLDEEHLCSTDNIYQWVIGLHSFSLDIPLGQDMKLLKVNSIVVELRFSDKFPFSPPFVRVIRPRFLDFQNGGGGHITAGGSICTELLTSEGWMPGYTIESVLLQIRLGMTSVEPRPARLLGAISPSPLNNGQYGVQEALAAYVRACRVHGWAVPKDLNEMMRNAT